MKRVLTSARVILSSARHQILVLRTSWKVPAILGIVQPAVLLLITVGASARVGAAAASRVATGVVLTASWSFTVWSGAGILQRERMEGTLACCMIGVRDLRLVVIGKSLGVSALSAAMIAATTTATLALIGQPVRFDNPLLLLLGLSCLLVSALVLGAGLSCLFLLSRFGPQISSALMYPVFLLAGLLTPLSAVPAALRWVSDLLSPHWAMRFITATVDGRFDVTAFAMLLVLTGVYAVAGGYAFARVSVIVRREGSLELV